MFRVLIFLFFFIVIGCGTGVEISKSPTIFGGFYDSGTSHCYLLFKKDSTFEWSSGSALSAADNYQGKYVQRDSIIELDKIGFDPVMKSNRLLHTTVHPNPRGLSGDYFVQVNNQNRVVDSIFIFSVREFSLDSLKNHAHDISYKKLRTDK